MPTSSTTVRDEPGALRVLLHLQVDAEDAADRLLDPAAGSAPGVEPFPDLRDRGHHLRPDRVHDVVAVSFHQRHHRGQPVHDLALGRGRHGIDQAAAVTAAHRARHRVGGRPQPLQDRRRVKLGGEQELGHLALHVVPQPRDRGELEPVRLLVQAYPAPEIMGVDAELAFDHDDVGRHQGEPARLLAVHRRCLGRQEELVLAEHPGGQVGQDQPGLDAGDPRSHRGHHRSGRPGPGPAGARAGSAFLQLLDQGLEDDAEAIHVRPDPAGPVHHRDSPERAVTSGRHSGDLVNRLLYGAGQVT